MAGNKLSVRVRMYRQGLGDCFLLTFRRGGRDAFNMMIDCGLFLGTKYGKEIMTRVAEDVRQASAGRLDAVVLTHEHWDHISGFSLAQDVFDRTGPDGRDFRFGEVWVGWTENPDDPRVKAAKERFEKKKRGLRAALREMTSRGSAGLRATVNALVNEFFGVEENLAALGLSGADTWRYVMRKAAAQPPRYCRPGDCYELDGLAGVRFYVLGPPADFELFDDEESPAEETYRRQLREAVTDSFLAAATGDDNSLFDAEAFLPFDEKYRIAAAEAGSDPQHGDFFKERYGFDADDANRWRRIDDDWLELAGELALNIDGITNNTCLALAIELVESGKVLIFPGDAQFGNWISWRDLRWQVPRAGTDGKRELKVEELLGRTVFYKVGHHGSHNATLRKSGLELMTSRELVAMIPTNQQFARGKKTAQTPEGWKMPEPELLDALEAKARGRVILADEYGGEAEPKRPLDERCRENDLTDGDRHKFLRAVKFGGSFVRLPEESNEPEPLYVEYEIKA